MSPGAVDWLLDRTVLPGYTSLGYRLRKPAWAELDARALEGRTIVVTGANSGIGMAACRLAAEAGARVEMVARDSERGERAREEICEATRSELIGLRRGDLSDPDSIRRLAAELAESNERIDGLVNNAGVMPPKRTRIRFGGSEAELTFATNVLGPHLLTALLLEPLRASDDARVVNVSSGGMYTSRLDVDDLELDDHEYSGNRFYAHTKRIEVILTELWQERLGGSGLSFHSMHPGWVATAGLAGSLPRFASALRPLLRDPEQGADTIVWLLAADLPLVSPGAFWHDRRPRPTHRVPWTRETPDERSRLWAAVNRRCGLSPGDASPVA